MLPDRVSNPGPLTYESGALPIALRGPAAPTRKLDTFPSVLLLSLISLWMWCALFVNRAWSLAGRNGKTTSNHYQKEYGCQVCIYFAK